MRVQDEVIVSRDTSIIDALQEISRLRLLNDPRAHVSEATYTALEERYDIVYHRCKALETLLQQAREKIAQLEQTPGDANESAADETTRPVREPH